MASVNEQNVREYFETLGFLVAQPSRHQVAARYKPERNGKIIKKEIW